MGGQTVRITCSTCGLKRKCDYNKLARKYYRLPYDFLCENRRNYINNLVKIKNA